MKYKILLYGLLAATITGCSSAYKASQTPDDVYYSPAAVQKQKVARNDDRYEDYASSDEDRYLRMKTRNRERWSTLDDYSYWNDSRYVPSMSYNYYHDNWNNQYAWNNWYSPYNYSMYGGFYGGGLGLNMGYYPSYGYNSYGYNSYGYNPYATNVYINKYPTRTYSNVNRPNLNGYTNRNYSNSSNASSNRQGLGNTLRRVFTPSNNTSYDNSNYSNRSANNTNTTTTPSRSYTPSSSSGSSSSSSGSAGRVTRPARN